MFFGKSFSIKNVFPRLLNLFIIVFLLSSQLALPVSAQSDLSLEVNSQGESIYSSDLLTLAPPEWGVMQTGFSCSSVTQIPQSECEALVALYNSTNGSMWLDNNGWLQTTTPCSWDHVYCLNGHVNELYLSDNQLNGNLPSELGDLLYLEFLNLSSNQLSGNIPPEIGNLTKLLGLNLYDSQLSGSIPSEFGDLTKLYYLYMEYNQLTGSIPAELGNLTNLNELLLNHNQLNGSIPPELGNLENLIHLSLANNELSGVIPSELGNLNFLYDLYLGDNQLSGNIPPELADLINLSALDLADNQLSGAIPTNLGYLENLNYLWLDGNTELSGAIPTSFTNLPLELFIYNNTSLCEPQDSSFQTWLSGISELSGTGLTCASAPPDVPDLLSPLNGEYFTEGDFITLYWNGDGDEYYGELWGGSSGITSFGWQTAKSKTVGQPLAGYSYSWHIKARNSYGQSIWSENRNFSIRPATPSNLTGFAPSCNQVTLNWKDNSTNEEGYKIYRNGILIGTVGNNTSSYQDNSVSENIPYSYHVRAFRDSIPSQPSNTMNITTPSCQPSSSVVLNGFEVAQSVQNLSSDVVLIENKPTITRVHLQGTVDSSIKPVITLTAKRLDGNSLEPLVWSGISKIVTLPDRMELSDTPYFLLTDKWTQGTVEVQLSANFPIQCPGLEVTDQSCLKKKIEFLSSPELKLKLIKITWMDGDRPVTPSDDDIEKVYKDIEAMFPVAHVKRYPAGSFKIPVSKISGKPITDEDFDYLNKIIQLYGPLSYLLNNDIFYLGVLSEPPEKGVFGMAAVGRNFGVAYITDRFSHAHELGHEVGRNHTLSNCPGGPEPNPDTNYPAGFNGGISQYWDGSAAYFGYRLATSADDLEDYINVYHPYTGDIMSYCDVRWISEYTYEGIRDDLFRWQETQIAALGEPVLLASGEEALVVSGSVSLTEDVGELSSVYKLEAPQAMHVPVPGPYAIRLEDASGAEINTYQFEPDQLSEGDTGLFVLVLPWSSGVHKVLLLHNGVVLDAHTATSHAPSVRVITPNGGEEYTGGSTTISWNAEDQDGDELSYIVQYSPDNGASWITLASEWPYTSLEIDVESLPGSDQALVRVIASDGLHNAEDESDGTFRLATHPPEVSISLPAINGMYIGSHTINFYGSAYDAEDEDLLETNFSWSSDLDGVLGTGPSLALNADTLSVGTHTITLTVTDSDSQSDSDTTTIEIYRDRPAMPANLSVPEDLQFSYYENGEPPDARDLSIRNSGDGEIGWSAAADQPWIQLSEISGTTPQNISISADPTGLSAGEYSGTITITSVEAGNSPQEVGLTLMVLPEPLNYPTVTSPGTENYRYISLRPRLAWTNVQEAVSYEGEVYACRYRRGQLYVDRKPYETFSTTNTDYRFGEYLAADSQYCFRVRAQFGDRSKGEWSGMATFLTPTVSPVIASPMTEGQVYGTLRPELSWYPLEYASSYEVEVYAGKYDENQGKWKRGILPYAAYKVEEESLRMPIYMVGDTKYWVRVRAIGPDNTPSSWSELKGFYTADLVVQITEPGTDGEEVGSLRPRLEWQAFEDAMRYEIKLYLTEEHNGMTKAREYGTVQTAGNETEYSFPYPEDLPRGAQMLFQVRAVGPEESRSGWSAMRMFYTPNEIPEITLPEEDGTMVSSLQPVLEWTGISEAVSYEIKVYTGKEEKGEKLRLREYGKFSVEGDETGYQFEEELPENTKMWVKVRGEGPNSYTEWSELRSFMTPEAGAGSAEEGEAEQFKPGPVLVRPVDGYVVEEEEIRLDWQDVEGEGLSYQVQVCGEESCVGGVILDEVVGASEHGIGRESLPAGTVYWRVRGVMDGEVWTEWSAIESFEVSGE